MKSFLPKALLMALAFALPALTHAAEAHRFAFGGSAKAGHTAVPADMVFSRARGFGFEPSQQAPGAGQPFLFSVRLPEGNYNVTVTLGGAAASNTTVKAELRRLMLENVRTAPGQTVTRTFTVNVRSPRIAATAHIPAGGVQLKVPRETEQEAVAWDDLLTLEFVGANPSLQSLEIVPVTTPTLFLLGDSTVCDQPQEPYASWGQMLTRFFKPGIAIANHGESGETYRDSLARRRLDKILGAMQPGDTVVMQFGHNDQKQLKAGNGGPFTTYQAEIRRHVAGIRTHGGVPVIVSPMERRAFDANGRVVASLIDYADAARQVAAELQVAFIDLNAMSKPMYEALGPERSRLAFAEPTPGKIDNTHHNNYGSYQLAKAIVTGLRAARLPVAAYVADDFGQYDPARPDPVETFAVAASTQFTSQRPLGDEDNK